MAESQRRILEQARPVTTELDRLIQQMETTLGKTHTVSPFTQLFTKHGMVTDNTKAAAAEEPKKQEQKQQQPKAKKEKAAKKPAQAAASAPAGDQAEELKVFSQCDIRVGKIVECEPHPESEKLYIEKIDLGEPEGRLRTIVSGLQAFVTLDEMLADKRVIVFANMKPRKLAGIMSEGMVLCAGNAEHTQVELMRPNKDTPIGERVTLEGELFGADGLTQDTQAILNPKRKIEPKLLDKLETNASNQGTFNKVLLSTSAGPITSQTLANVGVQ